MFTFTTPTYLCKNQKQAGLNRPEADNAVRRRQAGAFHQKAAAVRIDQPDRSTRTRALLVLETAAKSCYCIT